VNRDDGAHGLEGAPLAFLALLLSLNILPNAASARPNAQKGVLVHASIRNLGGEPFFPGVFPDRPFGEWSR
jgi:hypothetical protein